jgi:hypothetical protein
VSVSGSKDKGQLEIETFGQDPIELTKDRPMKVKHKQ